MENPFHPFYSNPEGCGIFAALQQTSGDLFAFIGSKDYDRHYTFELINI